MTETAAPAAVRIASVVVVTSPTTATPAPVRRASRSRRTVLYAVGVVLLVNLGLGLLGERNPRLKDPAYGDKWAKLRTQLAARPGEPLVLALGSSRTLLGFHGMHAENQLDRKAVAFNFGTPAAGPVTNLVYLRRLLDAGVKPDLLIVEVMPGLCSDGANGPAEQLTLPGERLTYCEVATVVEFGFDPSTVRPAWRESALLPWSKLRFQLLGRVVPSWMPWSLRFDWSRAADANGWATPPRQTVTAEERAEREANARKEYAGSLASVSPEGRPFEAIRAMLMECQQRGIATRLVLFPEGSSFRAMYPAGLDERLLAKLKRLAAEYGAPLTDARGWLSDDQMYDGHHMFSAGAEAFTARLTAEVLAPHLRRPRP